MSTNMKGVSTAGVLWRSIAEKNTLDTIYGTISMYSS